jgi:hypothetical protein
MAPANTFTRKPLKVGSDQAVQQARAKVLQGSRKLPGNHMHRATRAGPSVLTLRLVHVCTAFGYCCGLMWGGDAWA